MTKSELPVKQICLASIISNGLTNNKNAVLPKYANTNTVPFRPRSNKNETKMNYGMAVAVTATKNWVKLKS